MPDRSSTSSEPFATPSAGRPIRRPRWRSHKKMLARSQRRSSHAVSAIDRSRSASFSIRCQTAAARSTRRSSRIRFACRFRISICGIALATNAAAEPIAGRGSWGGAPPGRLGTRTTNAEVANSRAESADSMAEFSGSDQPSLSVASPVSSSARCTRFPVAGGRLFPAAVAPPPGEEFPVGSDSVSGVSPGSREDMSRGAPFRGRPG